MRTIILCAFLLIPPSISYAQPWAPEDEVASDQCRRAIETSEQQKQIPYHLLRAISLVESGRLDPRSGAWKPWPWTVDVNGQGHFYETKQAAVAAVHQMQTRGARSIDVGCMQVNLQNHPDAFATLDDAFDPVTNVRYASKFLRELFLNTNNWAIATAYYHSQTPVLAQAYALRIAAFLPASTAARAGFGHLRVRHSGPNPETQLAAAWAAADGQDAGFTIHRAPNGRMFGTVRDAMALRTVPHKAHRRTRGARF